MFTVTIFLFFPPAFWFILYTAHFLLYNTLDSGFQIEEKIPAAFPEQAPFYEDDETWLKKGKTIEREIYL